MRLLALAIDDFRNIASAQLEPAERATLVAGPNGQGKTNLLEAIYLLATLRPLRASRLAELVRFGQPRARVSGRFRLGGVERDFRVEVAEGVREAFVDDKPVRGVSDYFGGVSVVAFTPDDLAVIKGGPDGRRRLLDRAAFNRFPRHLEDSRDYARGLRHRNRLLKDGTTTELLDAYNEALAAAGGRVIARRAALVRELAARAAAGFSAIAAGDGALELRYESSGVPAEAAQDEAAAAAALLDALRRHAARDIDRGFTSVGPHGDDLEVTLAGKPARLFASQGQQRAIVLALRVAEIENLRERLGRPPLLLLDDVSSELDPARNGYLMHYLRESQMQVFLTTTDPRHVHEAAGPEARLFAVREGRFEVAAAPL